MGHVRGILDSEVLNMNVNLNSTRCGHGGVCVGEWRGRLGAGCSMRDTRDTWISVGGTGAYMAVEYFSCGGIISKQFVCYVERRIF